VSLADTLAFALSIAAHRGGVTAVENEPLPSTFALIVPV
jgi:hypothetical protein